MTASRTAQLMAGDYRPRRHSGRGAGSESCSSPSPWTPRSPSPTGAAAACHSGCPAGLESVPGPRTPPGLGEEAHRGKSSEVQPTCAFSFSFLCCLSAVREPAWRSGCHALTGTASVRVRLMQPQRRAPRQEVGKRRRRAQACGQPLLCFATVLRGRAATPAGCVGRNGLRARSGCLASCSLRLRRKGSVPVDRRRMPSRVWRCHRAARRALWGRQRCPLRRRSILTSCS